MKPKFLMNKRGDIELTLRNIINIVIFIVIFLAVILPLMIGVYNFFFGKPDQGSVENFERLTGTLTQQGVLNDIIFSENTKENLTTSYFLKDNRAILVGFNSDCSPFEEDESCPASDCTGSGDKEYRIPKPAQCDVAQSCLCLYQDTNLADFKDKDNKPIKCVSFSKNVVFLGDGNFNQGLPYKEFEHLLIYGECGSSEFSTKILFIEKLEKEGKTYMLLTVNPPEKTLKDLKV